MYQEDLRAYFNYELKVQEVWGLIKLSVDKLIAVFVKKYTISKAFFDWCSMYYKLTNKANLQMLYDDFNRILLTKCSSM